LDDPIRPFAALFPAAVVEGPIGEHPRGWVDEARSGTDFDVRFRLQDFERPVRRSVVKDDIAVDDLVIVPEEKSQHVRVVPAPRIQVHSHAYSLFGAFATGT